MAYFHVSSPVTVGAHHRLIQELHQFARIETILLAQIDEQLAIAC